MRHLLAALIALVLIASAAACSLSESRAKFFAPSSPEDAATRDQGPIWTIPTSAAGRPKCTPGGCDDGLDCTAEICAAGRCEHILAPGRCLIAGRCYRDGEAVSTPCGICASGISASSATFASGSACDDGDPKTVADTCLAKRCRGFMSRTWVPSDGAQSSVLRAVAKVPRSMHAWAVGSYETVGDGHDRGMILRLDGAASPSHEQLVAWPLVGIHGNVAAGQAGKAFLYPSRPSGRWEHAPGLEAGLGDLSVEGVWTARAGAEAVYFFSGAEARVLRCATGDAGLTFDCVRQVGVAGDIVRVASAPRGPAPVLWALRGDGRQEIFSATEPAGRWSTSGSRACSDEAGASGACVDSLGPFADLWVLSADEAWAVGHHGLVLHYDGSRWLRMSIPTISAPTLNDYDFRGVWGEGEVTFVVGERRTPERWELVIVMYNARLGRWFRPQRLLSLPDSQAVRETTRLFDVGGSGRGEIYCVGGRWEASVASQQAVIFSRVVPVP